ncbi:MAG TPA: PepSY-associated TM helix domain-containing protein [Candidatus Sulfotelmatobacter sp.]|nr:PepSY-associated TM helix domain-containing protein [Candidatus Sulfotelmatobacter sp.]
MRSVFALPALVCATTVMFESPIRVRRFIFNVHLILAACAGAFVVTLAGTGSIIEFEPELDRAFHARLAYVRAGQDPLSLVEIGNAVSRRFGGEPVVAYFLAAKPDLSWQVALPSGIAYVNQYTGEVLGERRRGETFLGLVRELHLRLGGGELGGGILKWSTVAMLFSLVSGLYLWWPNKQIRIRLMRSKRLRWSDLHHTVGIVSLLPLGLLATSGVILGFEGQLAPVVYRLTDSRPAVVSRFSASVHQTEAATITPDQAVAIARRLVPNAVAYRVQMPKYGGVYQVALSDANDGVAGDRNIVALDPYGNVVSVVKSSTVSRGDRVFMVNEAIHTGNILGVPTRIGALLGTIAALVQVSSGLAMWMYRRKIVGTSAVPLEATQ